MLFEYTSFFFSSFFLSLSVPNFFTPLLFFFFFPRHFHFSLLTDFQFFPTLPPILQSNTPCPQAVKLMHMAYAVILAGEELLEANATRRECKEGRNIHVYFEAQGTNNMFLIYVFVLLSSSHTPPHVSHTHTQNKNTCSNCNHLFCQPCAERYFSKKMICPLCDVSFECGGNLT
jgi:hypothetical protein